MKTLLASGSNLHYQLLPPESSSASPPPPALISALHPIFANLHSARVLYAGLSDVLLEITPASTAQTPQLYLRGISAHLINTRINPERESLWELKLPFPCKLPNGGDGWTIHKGFGDQNGEFVGVVLKREVERDGWEERSGRVKILDKMVGGWVEEELQIWKPEKHMEERVTGVEGGEESPQKQKEREHVGGDEGAGTQRHLQEQAEIAREARAVDISVAGNGAVAVIVSSSPASGSYGNSNNNNQIYHLHIYPSLDTILPSTTIKNNQPNNLPIPIIHELPLDSSPVSLVSTQTSHAILLHHDIPHPQSHLQSQPDLHQPPTLPYTILTTGDPRHLALLLHDQSFQLSPLPSSLPPSSPIQPLLPPPQLEGLPTHITSLVSSPCSGGWYVAAISDASSSGVYLWGGRRGALSRDLKSAIAKHGRLQEGEDDGNEDGEDDVLLVPLPPLSCSLFFHRSEEQGRERDGKRDEEGELDIDIHTLALGSSHLLILTTTGEMFSIGRGAEGQLGATTGMPEWTDKWVKTDLQGERRRAVGIWAGGWGSWVLVEGDEGS